MQTTKRQSQSQPMPLLSLTPPPLPPSLRTPATQNNRVAQITEFGKQQKSPRENTLRHDDLKIFELRKQNDLLVAKVRQRSQQYLEQPAKPIALSRFILYESKKTELENLILKTQSQQQQAKHIHQKYLHIYDLLIEESRRFDADLITLEDILIKQDAELRRILSLAETLLTEKDKKKELLQKSEQCVNLSKQMQENQIQEMKEKYEHTTFMLDKFERTLGATGKQLSDTKSLGSDMDDDSMSHKNGDDIETDGPMKEETKKKIMLRLAVITGATKPEDIVQAFAAQRGSHDRLLYLKELLEAKKSELKKQKYNLMFALDKEKFTSKSDGKTGDQTSQLLTTEIQELDTLTKTNAQVQASRCTMIGELKTKLNGMIAKISTMPDGRTKLMSLQLPAIVTEYVSAAVCANESGPLRSGSQNLSAELQNDAPDASKVATPFRIFNVAPVRTSTQPSPCPSDDEDDIPSRTTIRANAQMYDKSKKNSNKSMALKKN